MNGEANGHANPQASAQAASGHPGAPESAWSAWKKANLTRTRLTVAANVLLIMGSQGALHR